MAGGLHNGERVVANRYRLHERLGSGGMGTVWRGEDVVLGRDVAVKEVTFPFGTSGAEREVLRERIRREARAAARLDHPGVVTLHDVVEEGLATYLVMQYVPAQTLSEFIARNGPLSPHQTALVGLAVLGALRAAHARGILHRDVKPSNVLLSKQDESALDRVLLTDFGIASSPGDSRLTTTGLVIGSPGYIAPERARGGVPGPASDLWSLGATLFTAVEGHPPYDAGDPVATLAAVLVGEHAPYVRAGPLQPVLDRLLERNPAERMGAAEAKQALDEVAASPLNRASMVLLPPSPDAIHPKAAAETVVLHLQAPSPNGQEAASAASPTPAPQAEPADRADPPDPID
ncbi:MAG: serine/threonine protein kinase, partial [Actinomycetota bacterium]|nr:serine/threonine protein kinase [Actinomycetota bacterium]